MDNEYLNFFEEEEEEELVPSAEEKQAEEEALAEVEADDLRTKLAEELGIDPDEESELLDKVVEREVSHRKKLSGAIKQKRSWRERAERLPKKPTGESQKKEGLTLEEVDHRFQELTEKRELESLDLSDDLKDEVVKISKVKSISIREASKDPYIQFKKSEMEKEERVKAATPKRSNKPSYAPSVDLTKPLNPADFDFNSAEGVKAWKEAKADRARAMRQR